MELSLRKKVNYQNTRMDREFMIRQEKLHILDSITYDYFLILYHDYSGSNDMSEEEFAKYFLDIDWRSFYNLSTGRRFSS